MRTHPEIQRTDAGFDRFAVANHDHEKSLRLDIRRGRLGHGLRRDRLNVLHVVRVIGIRKAVHDLLFDLGGEVADRFEVAREAEGDVVLGLRQLVGRDRLTDRSELVEELAERLRGLVGLHAGAGKEGTGGQTHVETRARAVRSSRVPPAGSD